MPAGALAHALFAPITAGIGPEGQAMCIDGTPEPAGGGVAAPAGTGGPAAGVGGGGGADATDPPWRHPPGWRFACPLAADTRSHSRTAIQP